MSSEPGKIGAEHGSTRTGLVIAGLLAVLAIVIGVNASMLGTGGANVRVGPALFPYVVAAGLFALAVGTALSALRGKTAVPDEKQDIEPIAWVVGGLVAQIALLAVGAGFSVASGLLFGLVARGFGKRQLWLTCLVGVVLAFVIWLAFAKLLQLSLPQGPLEHAVSALLNG